MAQAQAQYSVIVLGATGNIGGRIVRLLTENRLCKRVVVVTRRRTNAFSDPKVSEVVVNMDRLETEVAPPRSGNRRRVGFLAVFRPAVILGNSNTPGALNYVMSLLRWAVPSRYHSIHKNDLARAMVVRSEQAFFAMAQGRARHEPTVKILEYAEMRPLFVGSDRDAS